MSVRNQVENYGNRRTQARLHTDTNAHRGDSNS